MADTDHIQGAIELDREQVKCVEAPACPHGEPDYCPHCSADKEDVESRAPFAGQFAAMLAERINEQSGHFNDCPASEEIIHFQEAKPGSCCCADALALLTAWADAVQMPEGKA